MNKPILILFLFQSFSLSALDLFKAAYKVFKDGKEIGYNTLQLSQQGADFVMSDKTDGTHGMASFLGFKRSEETVFSDVDGVFHPKSYKMTQKVAFNKRTSEYQVDTETKTIQGTTKDIQWQLEIPKDAYSTPNLVSLNLANDICDGKTDLSYPILKNGEISSYQFKIIREENGIVEIDRVHSKPSRTTKTWLDKTRQCLPVRTYHKEEDEDAVETKLIEIKFNS